jgi:hypothetical protein
MSVLAAIIWVLIDMYLAPEFGIDYLADGPMLAWKALC